MAAISPMMYSDAPSFGMDMSEVLKALSERAGLVPEGSDAGDGAISFGETGSMALTSGGHMGRGTTSPQGLERTFSASELLSPMAERRNGERMFFQGSTPTQQGDRPVTANPNSSTLSAEEVEALPRHRSLSAGRSRGSPAGSPQGLRRLESDDNESVGGKSSASKASSNRPRRLTRGLSQASMERLDRSWPPWDPKDDPNYKKEWTPDHKKQMSHSHRSPLHSSLPTALTTVGKQDWESPTKKVGKKGPQPSRIRWHSSDARHNLYLSKNMKVEDNRQLLAVQETKGHAPSARSPLPKDFIDNPTEMAHQNPNIVRDAREWQDSWRVGRISFSHRRPDDIATSPMRPRRRPGSSSSRRSRSPPRPGSPSNDEIRLPTLRHSSVSFSDPQSIRVHLEGVAGSIATGDETGMAAKLRREEVLIQHLQGLWAEPSLQLHQSETSHFWTAIREQVMVGEAIPTLEKEIARASKTLSISEKMLKLVEKREQSSWCLHNFNKQFLGETSSFDYREFRGRPDFFTKLRAERERMTSDLLDQSMEILRLAIEWRHNVLTAFPFRTEDQRCLHRIRDDLNWLKSEVGQEWSMSLPLAEKLHDLESGVSEEIQEQSALPESVSLVDEYPLDAEEAENQMAQANNQRRNSNSGVKKPWTKSNLTIETGEEARRSPLQIVDTHLKKGMHATPPHIEVNTLSRYKKLQIRLYLENVEDHDLIGGVFRAEFVQRVVPGDQIGIHNGVKLTQKANKVWYAGGQLGTVGTESRNSVLQVRFDQPTTVTVEGLQALCNSLSFRTSAKPSKKKPLPRFLKLSVGFESGELVSCLIMLDVVALQEKAIRGRHKHDDGHEACCSIRVEKRRMRKLQEKEEVERKRQERDQQEEDADIEADTWLPSSTFAATKLQAAWRGMFERRRSSMSLHGSEDLGEGE